MVRPQRAPAEVVPRPREPADGNGAADGAAADGDVDLDAPPPSLLGLVAEISWRFFASLLPQRPPQEIH